MDHTDRTLNQQTADGRRDDLHLQEDSRTSPRRDYHDSENSNSNSSAHAVAENSLAGDTIKNEEVEEEDLYERIADGHPPKQEEGLPEMPSGPNQPSGHFLPVPPRPPLLLSYPQLVSSSEDSGMDSEHVHQRPRLPTRNLLPTVTSVVVPRQCYKQQRAELCVCLPEGRTILPSDSLDIHFVGQESKLEHTSTGYRGINRHTLTVFFPPWDYSEVVDIKVHVGSDCTRFVASGHVVVVSPSTRPAWVHVQLGPTKNYQAAGSSTECYGDNRTTEPKCQHQGDVQSYCSAGLSLALCFDGSHSTATAIVEKLVEFAMENGLPEDMSVDELLCAVPRVKSVLKSCSFARGSLDHFMDYVNQNSKNSTFAEDMVDFLKKVSKESQWEDDKDTEDYQVVSVANKTADVIDRCQHVYEEPAACFVREEITFMPGASGLSLPRDLVLPRAYCQQLLEDVRDKEITLLKAIELARDYVYSNPRELFHQQKQKKTGKGWAKLRNTLKRATKRIEANNDNVTQSSGESFLLSKQKPKPPSHKENKSSKSKEADDLERRSTFSQSTTSTTGGKQEGTSISSNESASGKRKTMKERFKGFMKSSSKDVARKNGKSSMSKARRNSLEEVTTLPKPATDDQWKRKSLDLDYALAAPTLGSEDTR